MVIAYEGASAGQRAMRAYEHLAAQSGDEYPYKCSLWNFEAVKGPEFREAATRFETQPAVSRRADSRDWGINE